MSNAAENTFHVHYASGDYAQYTTTDQSVESFCNSHFGSTWADAQEHGASVEMNPTQAQAPVKKAPEVDPDAALLEEAAKLEDEAEKLRAAADAHHNPPSSLEEPLKHE